MLLSGFLCDFLSSKIEFRIFTIFNCFFLLLTKECRYLRCQTTRCKTLRAGSALKFLQGFFYAQA